MPQIQYSEKYYDDIYEYRYVRIRVRRFPARLDALIVLLHATNGVRARSRGFPRARRNPRRARRRCPARYRTRARSSIARYTRSSACVSIGTRRDVSAGAFPARASLGIAERARRVPLRNRVAAHLASPSTAIDRHVVLPPDIAKLLPKGRLLSEVRHRSPRSGRDPPRPSFSDGGCELEIQRLPSPCTLTSNVWMRALVFQSLPASGLAPAACAPLVLPSPISDDPIPLCPSG